MKKARIKAGIGTIVIFILVVFLCGCTSLRRYEARDIESRVLGIDASIPIPFAKGVNLMNIRLGWVETKYAHTYDYPLSGKVKQKLNYLGEVEREYKIGK